MNSPSTTVMSLPSIVRLSEIVKNALIEIVSSVVAWSVSDLIIFLVMVSSVVILSEIGLISVLMMVSSVVMLSDNP